MQDIIDIKDVLTPEPDKPWALWTGIAVAILILSVLLYYVIKKLRNPTPTIPTTPKQVAQRELLKLSQSIETVEDENFAVQLSQILRDYIEAQYNLPSSKSTTQEFFQILAKKNPFSSDQSEQLNQFLALCDQVKFARHSLSITVKNELFDTANRFCKR